MSDFWEKFEQGMDKVNVWCQKRCEEMERQYERKKRELQKQLEKKTDDELIRISRNPELSDFHRGFVEDEMRRRGL